MADLTSGAAGNLTPMHPYLGALVVFLMTLATCLSAVIADPAPRHARAAHATEIQR